MTRAEFLARRLCKQDGKIPDAPVAYQRMPNGCCYRRDDADTFPTMPLWEWGYAATAEGICRSLGLDPQEEVTEEQS